MIGAIEEGVKRGWLQEDEVTEEVLEGFLSRYGRRFYKLEKHKTTEQQKIVLEKKGEKIPKCIGSEDGSILVVPFKSREDTWSLRWK